MITNPGSCRAAHHSLRALFRPFANPSPAFLLPRPLSTASSLPATRRDKSTSTTTSTATSTTTTLSTSPPQQATKQDKLNPLSTLSAPPLSLPTRAPSTSALKHYYHLGKAYLTFYKSGAARVYTNFRAAHALYPRLAHHSVSHAARAGLLTRAEHQLLLRSSHDARRVPVFALIFLICGEWTPLLVPFVSGLVPGPCRTPAQDATDLKKLEQRRRESFRDLTTGVNWDGLAVRSLSREQALHVARSLGLLSRVAERVGVAGVMDGVGLLRRRIRRRVEEVRLDDWLIARDGGVGGLDAGEVKRAASVRGLDVLGPGVGETRDRLGRWVACSRREEGEAVGEGRVLARVLTRPSVWDEAEKRGK